MSTAPWVLLADDDPVVRKTDSQRLARLGYQCQTAADAHEAMAFLAERDYDVLISDIEMPGNDDLALVTRAQTLRPGLPVLIVTGSPSFDTARLAVGLGVRAYLLKPVTSDILAAELDAAVRVRRLYRAAQATSTRLGELDDQPDANLEQLLWAVASAASELGELQAHSAAGLGEPTSTMAAAVSKMDLVGALRETVDVLQETRKAFHSKTLARLRRHLEELLGGVS